MIIKIGNSDSRLSLRRLCMVVSVVLAVVAVAAIFERRNYYASEDYCKDYLNGISPSVLLSASRKMMSMPSDSNYGAEKLQGGGFELNIAATNIQQYPWIPGEVIWLHPKYIAVRSSYVVIVLDTPGRRTGFLAFNEGVEQSGTKRIIDGLWFWDGKIRNSQMAHAATGK